MKRWVRCVARVSAELMKCHILVGVVLEEFLTGHGTAQAAQSPELGLMDVGDSRAFKTI